MDWVNRDRKSWIFKLDVHDMSTIGSFDGWICVRVRCSIRSILFKTINLLNEFNAEELVWNKSVRCWSICAVRFPSSFKVLTSMTRIRRSQVVALQQKASATSKIFEVYGPIQCSGHAFMFDLDPVLSSSQLYHKWPLDNRQDRSLIRWRLVWCQQCERRLQWAFALK